MVLPRIPPMRDHPHDLRRDHGVLQLFGEHDRQRAVAMGAGAETGHVLRVRPGHSIHHDDAAGQLLPKDQLLVPAWRHGHAGRHTDAIGRRSQRQQRMDRHSGRVHHAARGNRQAGVMHLDAERADQRAQAGEEGRRAPRVLQAYSRLSVRVLPGHVRQGSWYGLDYSRNWRHCIAAWRIPRQMACRSRAAWHMRYRRIHSD